MHSCGYNWALIDDLVEAGVDCFQFDQPSAYDMPALAKKLREKKVGLWAPVDIQKVLPTGDRTFIEAESRRLVETFRGGLMLKNYGDLNGIGVQPEWDQWAYEALVKAAGL
jgi:uroporphyrinogen-III decarboxylase